MDDSEIEELIELVEQDMEFLMQLKEENRKLREANRKLRKKLSDVAQELHEYKKQEDTEYNYSYDEGWDSDLGHKADDVTDIDPADIEDQMMKINSLLEEIDHD